MAHKLNFFCMEEDLPVSITLEPEGMLFEARYGREISFVALSEDPEFKWAIRNIQPYQSILLYPESSMSFSVQVYENDELVFET